MDIALPLDLPIAAFVPELAKLVSSREIKRDEDVSAREERKRHWVLRPLGSDVPLAPHSTLRNAGVGHGALLYLASERTLSPPTLYDDVVDAAAKLNRSSYAPWDAGSARIMGLAGLYLVAASFVYFLVNPIFAPQRSSVAAVSVVLVGALLAGAAVANRSYGRGDIAAALAWAGIPISAGACWSLLHDFGSFGVAGACLAMIALNVGAYRLVGAGIWGFLCSSVIFALAGIALLAQGIFSPDPGVTGVVLAVMSALLTLVVPALTATLGQFEPPTVEVEEDDELFENPFNMPTEKDLRAQQHSVESVPNAETVLARVRMAQTIRSSLFAGVAVGSAIGLAATLRPATEVGWGHLVLAGAIAGVLALRARLRPTTLERASLGVPAIVITITACVLAQPGPTPIGAVAFGILLVLCVSSAAVGAFLAGRHVAGGLSTALTYLEYLLVGSLIPLGLWAAGAYHQLGGPPW